jgi:PAS domain S-box-containing protein
MAHLARIPVDEEDRLQAVRRLGLQSAPTTVSFDRMTQLAARALATPIALISVIDETRQWFLSRRGIQLSATARDSSFCAHALMQRRLLIVSDATLDARFATNPLVVGPPYIRAYAGAPIYTRDGYAIGALCVIDVKPRQFEVAEVDLLRDYALLVEDFIAAHESMVQAHAAQRRTQERERHNNEALRMHLDSLLESQIAGRLVERRMRLITDCVPALIGYWNRNLECEFANEAYRDMLGLEPAHMTGRRMRELLGDAVFQGAQPHIEAVLAGSPQRFEQVQRRPDGTRAVFDVRYEPDFDDLGMVRGWCVLVTDITERAA